MSGSMAKPADDLGQAEAAAKLENPEPQAISSDRIKVRWPVLDRLLAAGPTLLSERIVTAWGLKAEIGRAPVQSGRLAALVDGLAPGTLIGRVRGASGSDVGVIAIDRAAVFAVLAFVLGDHSGAGVEMPEARIYTPFEASLMRPLAAHVLEAAGSALAPAGRLSLTLEGWVAEGEVIADAPAMVEAFDLTFGDTIGSIRFILPLAMLAPLSDALGGFFPGRAEPNSDAWQQALARQVAHAHASLVVVLHEQSLPLGRVRGLKPGETLVFDAPSDPVIGIYAERIRVAEGRLGRSDGRIAIKLDTAISARKDAQP